MNSQKVYQKQEMFGGAGVYECEWGSYFCKIYTIILNFGSRSCVEGERERHASRGRGIFFVWRATADIPWSTKTRNYLEKIILLDSFRPRHHVQES